MGKFIFLAFGCTVYIITILSVQLTLVNLLHRNPQLRLFANLKTLRPSDQINSAGGQYTTDSRGQEDSAREDADFIASSNRELNASQNPWEGVSPKLTIRNYYTGKFIESYAEICSGKHKNLTLLVLVPSAIYNFEQRNAVRRTWGSFSKRKDVAIGFAVGDPNFSTPGKESMRNKFQEEVELYRDIVIADMKDTYRNLTLKVLYMMEWAFTRCSQARYYMKVDDDVFFNVPLVLDFIASIQESDKVPKIYGNIWSGHLPNRNKRATHFVDFDVYPFNATYPNFTSGPAYLFSSVLLQPLLKAAQRFPLFNLEDVLLTGFTAARLGIPRVNVTLFRNERENPFRMSACKLLTTVSGMTRGSPIEIYHAWYNYLVGKLICRQTVSKYYIDLSST